MARHPFERLPDRALRVACVSLLVAWAVLTVVLAAAVPLAHMRELLRLLAAEGAGEAAAQVAAWSPAVRTSVGFVVRFDYLYDVVHNNAVALLCLWAARRLARPTATKAARLAAWVLWLDTLLNVVENAAALHIVNGGDAAPWFAVVRVLTSFRFVTLWLACGLGALGFMASARNRIGPSRT